MTENKMRLQLIESTFAALARTRCAEIAHQPETERNGGWGGGRSFEHKPQHHTQGRNSRTVTGCV